MSEWWLHFRSNAEASALRADQCRCKSGLEPDLGGPEVVGSHLYNTLNQKA